MSDVRFPVSAETKTSKPSWPRVETHSLPSSLAPALVTLPSMSLIPFAPFAEIASELSTEVLTISAVASAVVGLALVASARFSVPWR